jgi:hypothetical protein
MGMRSFLLAIMVALACVAEASAQTATRLRNLTTGTAGNITSTSKLVLDDAAFPQAKAFTPDVFLDGIGLGPADSPAWQAITLTGALSAGGVTLPSGTLTAPDLGVGVLHTTTGGVVTGSATTANLTESGNLYFTTARARESIFAGTGMTYDNTTGTMSNAGVTSLAGTANQITASSSTGGITLSTPQDIHTGASPTFVGMTLSGPLVSTGSTITLTQSAATSGDMPLALSVRPGAHTGLGTNSTHDIAFNLLRLVTFTSGAIGDAGGVIITSPGYGFSTTAGTITNAATVNILGAPLESTNATITNAHTLKLTTRGGISSTNSYGLTVEANTGAANNYAAQFTGGNVGIGTSAPAAMLQITKTTEQLRFGYDSSNYGSGTVASDGAVTLNAVGSGSAFTFQDAVTVQSNLTTTGNLAVTGTSSLGGAVTLTGNATITGTVNITGAIQADSIVNDTGLASGTYTPTLTTEINASAATVPFGPFQYMRVGNIVTVSGFVQVDAVATGLTTVGISLPIASNIADFGDCGGSCTSSVNDGGTIQADATNDRVTLVYTTATTANQSRAVHFTYVVK